MTNTLFALETSHAAADAVSEKSATQAAEAVALVRRLPGQTAGELAQACGRQSYELRKRLADGRTGKRLTNGPDRICTVEGTKQQTWYATN